MNTYNPPDAQQPRTWFHTDFNTDLKYYSFTKEVAADLKRLLRSMMSQVTISVRWFGPAAVAGCLALIRYREVIMLRITLAAVLCSTVSLASGEERQSVAEKPMITRQLPIPPRVQWRDRAGYCGECSIQQSALFYGNYVSQYVCRQIIDPTQKQDVLVRVNADLVLEALRLTYEEFDTTETPTPQYKVYLEWTKRHLHQEHPVIITVFDQDDDCWDYDHIVLATGFKSANADKFHPDDTLVFNDNFKLDQQRRPFKTLHDSRDMKGNGAEYYFCIPTLYNFGCAVTGIEDETGELLPVSVTVDRADEPDIVKAEKPVPLTLDVTIRGLNPGASYVLYRYDNYKHLPTRNYEKSKYHSARKFVAERATHKFTDRCDSHGASFYRCLPTRSKAAAPAK